MERRNNSSILRVCGQLKKLRGSGAPVAVGIPTASQSPLLHEPHFSTIELELTRLDSSRTH